MNSNNQKVVYGWSTTYKARQKKEGEEEFESQPAIIKKGAPRKLKKRCYYACQSQEGHISRDSFPPGNESNRDLRY